MSEQHGNQPDEVMQRAAEIAISRIDQTGEVDPLSLATAKRAELEQRERDAAQKAEEERLAQEKLAEEMIPTPEDIQEREAKNARMAEMERWANTTGAIAEAKAKAAAENERTFKVDVENSATADDIDYHTDRYQAENKRISEEDVSTKYIPGSTYQQAHVGGGGWHDIVDEKGTTKSTIGGWDEYNRSPQNIRDDNLPHGSHDNPDVPTFR